MSELRFTAEHEWLRVEENGQVTVGITVFAQEALGDVVYVQLPELQRFSAHAEVSVVESVKAASSIYMPLDGEITEVNEALADTPELVNEAPLAEGWFFRFVPADPSQLAGLLDAAGYDQLISTQA
ncbi:MULTISPECIES: glycine cleavage system protein GcvH [unclassified Pseudomonas]|uniref:glycine cleavage system protein GcvH n=1 Tax=unclassified Pseudomonas TaxID=196821 RepID=UPI000BDAB495|nr:MULTISPECIES: glycine cleavage system protein GcvH [unclassified Pseudomonas]PVZ11241.1 glycine cleavage system H protein [Pseudomonas sp. URIL14HWK12:I12]PVZ22239.1 glycine cleavage system H protein [Pseudomonas sp. URIL14HWK12:I10]PVZ31637.1 glycine cleavage system H protein [Pseudomonas sp. URIL14HWK12:I11]SNZ16671.1 glycine cleavage system H protein [Pseudomonas sp. URIL14HWK12:I9]